MSTTPLQSQVVMPAQAPADDEIDLGQLAATLKRRWRLIGAAAGGTLALSGIVTLLQKPVWEGEFQIVLAQKESPGSGAQALLQSNPGLANLIGAKGGENQLETEVKILESPSVLKPIFDEVKSLKAKSGEDVSNWLYSDWLESNLEIKLEKGTSVLNLSYRDTDKPLVIPTLEKISKAYQAYSGRDRERGIQQAIRYLDQQIETYRSQSLASLRRAQQFAIEQDLTALKGDGENDKEIRNSFNIEAIRVEAANRIRNIDQQLKQLRALGTDPEAVMFRGLVIPELATKGIYQSLDEMDTQLAILRSKFTDGDETIRRLVERRRLLIGVLKRQTYGYLLAQRTDAQAKLAAAERPKGVLIRYRELVRESARDEATLTRLENERQVLALEQARKQDPWELISKPTLLDKPVSPKKSRNLALGLLAGLVLGSGAALVVERRSGKVFAIDDLRSALPGDLLAELEECSGAASVQAVLQLLASGPLAASGSGSLALIPVGLEQAAIEGLRQALETACQRPVLCSTDLVACRSCATQLLITTPGAATRVQLAELRQQLRLQGTPIAGWLLLKPASEG